MQKNINAHCAICGTGYHVCSDCSEQKQFRPWRTVVDKIEHYKIYLVIHEYTITGNKKNAQTDLKSCDLTDISTFNKEIQSAISEIMKEDKVAAPKSKTASKKMVAKSTASKPNVVDENE